MLHNPVVEAGDELESSVGSTHPHADNFNANDRMMFEDKGTTREHIAYIRIAPQTKAASFYVEASLRTSLVFFRSASEEYDQYMKSSVQKMMVYNAFEDPTQWLDENEVYSNISNGLGVFAAYADRIIPCHYSLDRIEEPWEAQL